MAQYFLSYQFAKLQIKDPNKRKTFVVEARSHEEAYNKIKSFVGSDPRFHEIATPNADDLMPIGPQNAVDIFVD